VREQARPLHRPDGRIGKRHFIGRFPTREAATEALDDAKRAAGASKGGGASAPSGPGYAASPDLEVVGVGGGGDDDDEDPVATVREALRILVARVDAQSRRPPPTMLYGRPAAPARLCRFGVQCRRSDTSHWQEADHPADHPQLGREAPPPPPFSLAKDVLPCHHWRHKGFCAVGDACLFMHGASARGDALMPGTNHRLRPGQAKWRTRGRKNGSRGAVFRRFLLDSFGASLLRRGSGVLDVAGGGSGGGLAFQLLNYSGVPATVVDPRPPLSRKAVDSLT